ncbi:proline--tRNA ligase [Candidatus Nucleicultrix amoebiphila]|jgi:prolyl-tRNA synthetase|uniref:Proline--tRNA ligase n=1 Tax=Candidatus Nucleicultrix amoebiphila FS5 TaxID=1414854 RepID=A0A1W6N3H1_9PROT|nr:proline--tRNA ligase [Candidatus Nucleicultrix amoebiphila]ARN84372.1 proline--tRNA ligase [Candidatus Nucleicultrix amoebiphila FS5]
MRLSRYFLPTIKENPSEAQVVSHRLMLRSGMILQSSAGIYSWLPLGTRVLKNVERIIRQEQNRAGAYEVIMPTIQSADLWMESGRYNAYGDEMLRIKDRQERDMLYSPTAEEVVTDIGRKFMKSYRDLPQMLYQINWKFRDEIRPRFGVMRGREFLMKDCYSFDLNFEDAQKSYRTMMEAYMRTFTRLGLKAVPVRASSGPIGGDMSHEFQILANTGESLIYYDADLEKLMETETFDIEHLMGLYAADEEMHDAKNCPVPQDRLKSKRGIEVGHVFYLGTKYSDPLKAHIIDKGGQNITVHMGCYGIGVSRLVAAIIEASHDDVGIVWPASVAPFDVALLNLKPDDEKCTKASDDLYLKLQQHCLDVLYDDRSERSGVKFATHDLIGLPWQIRFGSRSLESNTYELKNRRTGEVLENVSWDNLIDAIKGPHKSCCS